MGFLDKVKDAAGKAADQAKHATAVGKEKLEDKKLEKKIETLCQEIGALVVHVFLGDAASLGTVLGRVLLPSLALNVVLAVPAYWLMRKLFPPTQRREREVVALG